jgi:hypothetical protein
VFDVPTVEELIQLILKQQKEGDREVVKNSGRDESIWVVIHLCMEAVLGIFLYSLSLTQLAKTLCLSYYCLCLHQNWRKGQNRFCLEVRVVVGRGRRQGAVGRNDPNNVCTYEYMNKEKKEKKKLK